MVPTPQSEFVLELVCLHRVVVGVEELTLHTNVGDIVTWLHPAPQGAPAVVWVGGSGGGLDGPAWGMYPRLAGRLAAQGIALLRLHYRRPNHLVDCVADTLLGALYLVQQRGYRRVALVGHSFGGAVVISAGALSEEVTAVVAMRSQTYGQPGAASKPRPLLLHGTAAEILSHRCSESIYARARQPKELLLYNSCRHGPDECRERVDEALVDWLRKEQVGQRTLPACCVVMLSSPSVIFTALLAA